MARPSLRENILQAGLKVMFRSGFHGASVRDICAAAGAPQGSFTNHFRSKEAFTREVLDRYFDSIRALMRETVSNPALAPRQRLGRYLDAIIGRLEADHWNRGCLIGDLSLEASTQSKPLRRRLEEIFREWRAPFADCIAEAQAAGEIDTAHAPLELAEFLLASWQGAILRMKVEQGPAPLERFKKIAFSTVFRPVKPRTEGKK